MEKKVFLFCMILSMLSTSCKQKDATLYRSDEYSIFSDKVQQGSFEAKALSSTQMVSNYRSPEYSRYSPTVQFKFSINSHDNELPYGKNHEVTLVPVDGKYTTTVEFGKQLLQKDSAAEASDLPRNTRWTIRLDMRKVLAAFDTNGFYTLYNGEVLTKTDFKGVYIAGSAAPLSWDFSNLYAHREMELTDADGDGIYEINLNMNSRTEEKQTPQQWQLCRDISAQAQYHSDYLISDAIYNLSLEEMLGAIEPDSTFRTGKEWAGVWTRDISYSIILSMAYMQPQVARHSLMRKVKNDRIIQDTGTGGAYPVSSDRVIWAVAAWELYKATGDNEWLQYAFKVVKNSLEDDRKNLYDPATGLVKGESSFLDWREQTYPKWMQPADIYQSENLGTNAVHYQANKVLAEMASLLGDSACATEHNRLAEGIKAGIRRYLWMPYKGYHAQYLYGRNSMMVSPRAETLGEALCVLFGITDAATARTTVEKFPVVKYGASCIYPQIPGIPPYHNNGIWPFVQSFWALASARTSNETAVMEQIAAIYRPTAFYLTNKENFVAQTGDFAGTQVNSSNMLWSLSGNLALVHRILFGIDLKADRLTFTPFVPRKLAGKRTLTNFRYRHAVLNITMEGYGNTIKSFEVNGQRSSRPEISGNATGTMNIHIVLNNNLPEEAKINKVDNAVTPETPVVRVNNIQLSWEKVKEATSYTVYKDGKVLTTTSDTVLLINPDEAMEYQVTASAKNGLSSFASAPVQVRKPFTVISAGSLLLTTSQHRALSWELNVETVGAYALVFRYANGNGPVNTDSKCAFRALHINNEFAGTVVFPQRGTHEWSNIGQSNVVRVHLVPGKNTIGLQFENQNENMDGNVNEARIYELLVYKITP